LNKGFASLLNSKKDNADIIAIPLTARILYNYGHSCKSWIQRPRHASKHSHSCH